MAFQQHAYLGFPRRLTSSARRSGQLLIRCTPEQSCWVALPSQLATKLFSERHQLPLALELSPLSVRTSTDASRQPVKYIAWAGTVCATNGTAEIPSSLAACLGLRTDTRVQVMSSLAASALRASRCLCLMWAVIMPCMFMVSPRQAAMLLRPPCCSGHLSQPESLQVRALKDVPKAATVTVEPASENDWEVVELNAGYLEQHILQQVRRAIGSSPGRQC